ncbi:MAG: imidazole glycerol phosphate synthase subunit HisH [Actinomycetota bacterium]|nr:imidazole glycerol phosphate synthase subunit HisH [Actinomycetota bacterium]
MRIVDPQPGDDLEPVDDPGPAAAPAHGAEPADRSGEGDGADRAGEGDGADRAGEGADKRGATGRAAPFVAVLDYGIGNLRSAERALRKVGAAARLVTCAEGAAGAAGVVLPGVGAFGKCAEALRGSGLDRVALDAIESGTPFFGICVGMQLLYAGSEEDPGAVGLGVFPRRVVGLPPGVKRPQMQWNQVVPTEAGRNSALVGSVGTAAWFYFVHSFAPEIGAETVATCDYGGPVVAACERENVWATQFHPEKSGEDGLALLAAFVGRCGKGASAGSAEMSTGGTGRRSAQAVGGGA